MPYYKLLYHAVWSVKNRSPWITVEVETVIGAAIETTCHEMGIQLHGIGTASDHVHVVFAGNPTLDLSKLIGRRKGSSSHAVNLSNLVEAQFQWQREYGILSLTERALLTVLDYVNDQRSKRGRQELLAGLERYE